MLPKPDKLIRYRQAISVTAQGGTDPLRFAVRVSEGASESRHEVTLALADLPAGADPARAVEAAFAFLLDREPKEAILARFDVSLISKYFPDFAREWPGYLKALP